MEQKAKQRLIGAVVLVALAVIFIPMMLKGPVDRGTVNVPIEIPPRPNMPVSGQTAAEGDHMARRAPTPVYGESAPAQSDNAPSQQASAPDKEEAPGPAKSESTTAPAQQSASSTEPKASAPAGKSEPVATRTPPELAEWAVQVGSFRNKANALGLRDQLRKKGYDAYVDEVELDGKPLYRLRVGPVAKRPKAEELARKLKSEEKVNALVVSHSG